MSECECGNAKRRSAKACDRCLAIEAELWRWLPMPNGRVHALRETEAEQAFKRFTHRFYGFAEDAWRKQCREELRRLEIHPFRGAARRPRDYEWPLLDGVEMTIAQAADDTRLPVWAA